MGYGYSPDLRVRAVNAYNANLGSLEAVAETFQIGSATLKRWLRLHREVGNLSPKPVGGGPTRHIDEEGDAWLKAQVAVHNDRTLQEWCDAYAAAHGVKVSVATMCRTLARLGLTRKKSPSSRPSRSDRRSSTPGPSSSKR